MSADEDDPNRPWTEEEIDAKLAEIEANRLYPDFYFGGSVDVSDDPRDHINNAARSLDRGTFTERPSRRDAGAGAWRMPVDRTPFEEAIAALSERIGRLARTSVGDVLFAIGGLRRAVDHLERESVVLARSVGWSWQNVARALDVSTQTAHRRHAHVTPQPRVRWKRRAT